MNPEQESFPGKVINLRYDYGLQQQFLREWEYKSVVHDEWEFLRRRPFLEELDCDIKLMSSIFPFCIYNDGNFLSSLQTALSFLLVSYLMHFKEMVGTEHLRSHLNVIIWDALLPQVEKMTLFFFIVFQKKHQEMSSSWNFPCCHLSIGVTEPQDPRTHALWSAGPG